MDLPSNGLTSKSQYDNNDTMVNHRNCVVLLLVQLKVQRSNTRKYCWLLRQTILPSITVVSSHTASSIPFRQLCGYTVEFVQGVQLPFACMSSMKVFMSVISMTLPERRIVWVERDSGGSKAHAYFHLRCCSLANTSTIALMRHCFCMCGCCLLPFCICNIN